MLAMGPDFPQGVLSPTPVDLHDARASAFASLGMEQPKAWIGCPLQDAVKDDPHRVVFSEYHGHGVRGAAYMIRKGPWKMIWCTEAPHLLFKLDEDPMEERDLCHQCPEIMEQLEAELRSICDPDIENERAHAFQEKQLVSLDMMGL